MSKFSESIESFTLACRLMDGAWNFFLNAIFVEVATELNTFNSPVFFSKVVRVSLQRRRLLTLDMHQFYNKVTRLGSAESDYDS
jgi:hypothetical protein